MAAGAARYLWQSRIVVPFLLIAGVFLVLEHNQVIAEWRAMYPADPREKAALQFCYAATHEFNRMSHLARKACYEKWLPRLIASRL